MVKVLWFALLNLFVIACVNDPKLGGRPTIIPYKIGSATPTTPTTATALPLPVRPSNGISFNTDFCVCNAGKATIYSDCATFCAKNVTTAETLFASFTVTNPDILTSTTLNMKSTKGWCTAFLTDPNTGTSISTSPGCQLLAVPTNGDTIPIAVDVGAFKTDNSIQVPVATLTFDKSEIWRLTLVEKESGAKAGTIQISKIDTSSTSTVFDGKPLYMSSVNQYECLSRGYSVTTGTSSSQVYYNYAYGIDYLYTDKNKPDPVPNNMYGVICHDSSTYGNTDSITFPRLKLKKNMLRFWSVDDPRFYPLDTTKTYSFLSEILSRDLKNLGVTETPANLNSLFVQFNWPNGPDISATSGSAQSTSSSTNKALGFVMTPWIDKTTFLSYCPNDFLYRYSDNKLFTVLKDIIGIDTEGIYLGVRQAFNVVNSSNVTLKANDNYLLIRESLLKKIWFYIDDNGVKQVPTEENASSVTLRFYWPANPDTPHLQSNGQLMYTVSHPKELSNGSSVINSTTLINPNTIPHDRKFGCIPATAENIY